MNTHRRCTKIPVERQLTYIAILSLLIIYPLAATAAVDPICPSPCPADIALVIDTSGSMDVLIDDVKNAAKTMINLTCTDGARWLGLVYFNDTAGKLTPSLVAIDDPGDQALLNSLVDSLVTGGLTNMGDGIGNATELLVTTGRAGVPDVMIIVSDGEPNTGPNATVKALEAKLQGIIIVGLYIGDPVGGGDEFLQSISDYFINGSDPAFNITEAFITLSTSICPIIEEFGRPALVGGDAELSKAVDTRWIAALGGVIALTLVALKRRY